MGKEGSWVRIPRTFPFFRDAFNRDDSNRDDANRDDSNRSDSNRDDSVGMIQIGMILRMTTRPSLKNSHFGL